MSLSEFSILGHSGALLMSWWLEELSTIPDYLSYAGMFPVSDFTNYIPRTSHYPLDHPYPLQKLPCDTICNRDEYYQTFPTSYAKPSTYEFNRKRYQEPKCPEFDNSLQLDQEYSYLLNLPQTNSKSGNYSSVNTNNQTLINHSNQNEGISANQNNPVSDDHQSITVQDSNLEKDDATFLNKENAKAIKKSPMSFSEKKEKHLQSEQKRRSNFRTAINTLRSLIPHGSDQQYQMSHREVLRSSIVLIKGLQEYNNKLRRKLSQFST